MSKATFTLSAARALGFALLVGLAGSALAQSTVTTPFGAMQRSLVTITTVPSTAKMNVSGQVAITTRISRDPEFGNDKLILLFDLNGVAAKNGKTTYTTQYQEEFVKPLAPNYSIEFDFPVYLSTANSLAQVITANAKFALNVDTATGNITSGTGIVAGQ